MLDTSIQVQTERFEGPLGLLLLLVQKEEMDIQKMDITKITQQYLDYLKQMQDVNFDLAGDYLYMAATLLFLKSNSCIKEGEIAELNEQFGENSLNITSHADLIRRLEELRLFQKLGEKLWNIPRLGQDTFVKPKVNRKEIVNSILSPMDFSNLTMAMVDLMEKRRRSYQVVKRDRLSIKEKLMFLKDYLKEGLSTELLEVTSQHGDDSKTNLVITFISLLELARCKKINIFQNEQMGSIYVKVIETLEDFNIDNADGFDDEEEEEEDQSELLKIEDSAPISLFGSSQTIGQEDSHVE